MKMNEKINLCEILKDCPINTRFYSPMIGNCKLSSVNSFEVVVANPKGSLHINPNATATLNGYKTVELMLFPRQTQRDWSKWKCPKPKFDPKTLKAFDRVLARVDESNACYWFADFVSEPAAENKLTICLMGCDYPPMIIPYNDETKHLVGTSDEAPEFYRYWED